jgi:hypothetical protein
VAGQVASPGVDLPRLLAPLLLREVAAIAAIDALIAAERRPDYVVMYQATKTGKQANVEQMATLIRRQGRVPPEQGGFRKHILEVQSSMVQRVGGTSAALRAMRADEAGTLGLYTQAIGQVEGLARAGLRTALARSLVHCHLLTAHLAKRDGTVRDADILPQPLDRYFAGPAAKACMRCHLDRPGVLPPLERRDPHPYTYVCAGCHADARAEFPPDLASQFDRWPQSLQRTRVLQQAMGRSSILNAFHTVLFPLSGLDAERRVRAEERAVPVARVEPPPSPSADEPRAVLTAEARTELEAAYVATLFDYRSPRAFW